MLPAVRPAAAAAILLALVATGALAKRPAHSRPDAGAAAAPAEESVHVVRPGETLGGIARRAKVPRGLIAEANHLKQPWRVHPGQKLRLPRTRHHRVTEGETGFDIAFSTGVPWRTIAVANGLAPEAPLQPGQRLLIPTLIGAPQPAADAAAPPVSAAEPANAADTTAAPRFSVPLKGAVLRGFTSRTAADYHDGIDIAATHGAVVRAAAAGRVIFAGREPRDFGNLVVIDHGDGWQSAYGFLSRIAVARGEKVRGGARIGRAGHSGRARRDELHFELRHHDRPVDPGIVLDKGGETSPRHHRSTRNKSPEAR
ncbi:MAG: M23 family metallopeptidase [Sphingomonadales bacterium]|nr:M23 family metallopeptidase [Sphingomonadales bacterium]